MYLLWLRLDPLAIVVVLTLLGNLTNVNLWVEVCRKSLVVVSPVAVHDVEVVHLVKMILGSICGEDTGHAWVKTTPEDSRQPSLLKAVVISPLPAVLILSLV